jgi:predicted PurR-regulated permease PerM
MSQEKILDVSWESIFKIAIAIIGFYILYLIKNIVVWFIFALIISVLFNPAIDFLQRKRVPRVVAAVFIYIFVFGLIALFIYSTGSVFVSEISNFSKVFPQYFEKISPSLRGLGIPAFENLENFVNLLSGHIEKIATNILNAFFAIFGGIVSTLFVLTVAIFLSLEEKPVEKSLSLLFPKKYEAYILSLWRKCQTKVNGWFISRILGALFVGLLSYLTFLLFNVKYPLSLGLLAGFTNFIPVIGPLVAGIIIFLVVSIDNFLRALFVLLVFILIQQLESNILTPILTKKFVGLPSALVLIALAIGGTLWGFLGAVLAIPLFGILFEFIRDFLKKKQEEKTVVL